MVTHLWIDMSFFLGSLALPGGDVLQFQSYKPAEGHFSLLDNLCQLVAVDICTFDYDVYCQEFSGLSCIYWEKVNFASSQSGDVEKKETVQTSWASWNKVIIGFWSRSDTSMKKEADFVFHFFFY